MIHSFLETPVEFFKRVGPARADMLKKELKIFTFGELLSYFPFRYVDRSKIYKIGEIHDDTSYIQIQGKIGRITAAGSQAFKRLIATISDGTGEIDLVWFQGIKWVADLLIPGKNFYCIRKTFMVQRTFEYCTTLNWKHQPNTPPASKSTSDHFTILPKNSNPKDWTVREFLNS